MPSRQLPYPVFDADNHFYEPKEALTKFLPEHRKNVIDYIEVRGRTKIMVRNQVSDYIPNPTFEVVARPGAQEEYFRHGSGGKSFREVMGKPMKAIPAFREPAARLEVMDGLGLDYSLMFPTLASLVEERMRDDPKLIHVVVHALNEWLLDVWSFNYQDRIFPVPVISLPILDKAIEDSRTQCAQADRKAAFKRANQILNEDQPYNFGFARNILKREPSCRPNPLPPHPPLGPSSGCANAGCSASWWKRPRPRRTPIR